MMIKAAGNSGHRVQGIHIHERAAIRAAYTLMEMLISSVLIASLMSVIWGMLSMYNSYLTAGRQQSQEQQLIRSVFSSIESDIRQVAIADTNPQVQLLTESLDAAAEPENSDLLMDSISESGGEVSEQSQDTLEMLQFEVLRPSPNLRLIGLRGSDSTLRLNFLATPDFSATPSSSQSLLRSRQLAEEETASSLESTNTDTPIVPSFRTVLWYFRSLQSLSTGTTTTTGVSVETEGQTGNTIASISEPGLYRIETSAQRYLLSQTLNSDQGSESLETLPADTSVNPLELLLTEPVGSSGDTDRGTLQSNPLSEPIRIDAIPEVVRCRIRYFSGSTWLSNWNSEAQQALPLAIRIELTFVPASQLSAIRELLGAADSALSASNPGESAAPASQAVGSNQPNVALRKLERTILVQPIRHPFPMLDEAGVSGDATEPSGFTSGGAL